MDTQHAIDLCREAIILSLIVGAPVLLAALAVGLVIGLLQAVTQVQEHTLSYVPKLVAIVLVVSALLPWMIERVVQYSHDLITQIPAGL